MPNCLENSTLAQHGAQRASTPHTRSGSTHAQHGPGCALDFDDVGDTWPARVDHEHGAALEEIDSRGFVS
jgi:hypothetical protein